MLALMAAMGGGKVDPPEFGSAEVWFEEWLTGAQQLGEPAPDPYRDEMVALGLTRG